MKKAKILTLNIDLYFYNCPEATDEELECYKDILSTVLRTMGFDFFNLNRDEYGIKLNGFEFRTETSERELSNSSKLELLYRRERR